MKYIDKGRSEGARLLSGGDRLTHGIYSKRCFVLP